MASVAIIGAGIGGMACAARLAAKGHSVRIYEQSSTWGGRVGTITFAGQDRDLGPTSFTVPAVYRDLFLKTGRALEESVDLVDVDISRRFVFPDGSNLDMPGAGIGNSINAIGDALGGVAAVQWRTFMHRAASMWASSRSNVEASTPTVSRRINVPEFSGVRRIFASKKTFREFSAHHLKDLRLRQLVDQYALASGSDPRTSPASLATLPYLEQTFGTYSFEGGMYTLADALHARCVQLGVDIVCNAYVTGISGTDHVTGITVDGIHKSADIVVANCDMTQAYTLLSPASAAQVMARDASRMRKHHDSSSAALFFAQIKGNLEHATPRTVVFSDSPESELDDIFHGHVSESSSSIDIQVIDTSENGSHTIRTLMHAPNLATSGEAHWSRDPLVARTRLLSHLDSFLPNSIEFLDDDLTLIPDDLARHVHNSSGSLYGRQASQSSAGYNASHFPGLFFVGATAHPGSGLPFVGMSAELVANAIGRQ